MRGERFKDFGKSQFKDYHDSEEEYSTVERSQTVTTEKVTTGEF